MVGIVVAVGSECVCWILENVGLNPLHFQEYPRVFRLKTVHLSFNSWACISSKISCDAVPLFIWQWLKLCINATEEADTMTTAKICE